LQIVTQIATLQIAMNDSPPYSVLLLLEMFDKGHFFSSTDNNKNYINEFEIRLN